ncbi:OmpA family protein [Mobilitalea sibirica]|uniref:OmpA family protein n=1 Tax=Mobilitalea sibirica TaxID=1462919 RepID=A0A8J7KX25_9FIRM|nr:flagellar motor protein MotB [Mobilitalea sibirica]MBH1941995.1 OmpA family protein [Mobilitalea sibirica]
MARKKKQETSSGGNAPWLNTFADLMNLLLCFFVLLFAMSTIDAEKFEQISISLANTFGIFDGGKTAIGEGQLVSDGMTQLNNLDEYYSNMGEDNRQTETETPGEYDPTSQEDTEEEQENIETLNQAMEKIEAEMEKVSEQMYDQLAELTTEYNLGDYVELSIDPEYQFVQLSLKGNILYDSGNAEIKEDAQPILSRIGDVLQKFEGFAIEIEGHTDNVPMNSSTYKDNNWLSSARALNAAEFLIENKNLNPAKIKYSGRGEYDPLTSNATAEGRAKNRRIEIKIFNELSGK